MATTAEVSITITTCRFRHSRRSRPDCAYRSRVGRRTRAQAVPVRRPIERLPPAQPFPLQPFGEELTDGLGQLHAPGAGLPHPPAPPAKRTPQAREGPPRSQPRRLGRALHHRPPGRRRVTRNPIAPAHLRATPRTRAVVTTTARTAPLTEAELDATLYPEKAGRIRRFGRVLPDLDFDPPHPDLVQALTTARGPIFTDLDRRFPIPPPLVGGGQGEGPRGVAHGAREPLLPQALRQKPPHPPSPRHRRPKGPPPWPRPRTS
jgi:hypothetical protein